MSRDQQLIDAGAEQYSPATAYYWYDWIDGTPSQPGHYDTSQVSERKVESVIADPQYGERTDVLMADIEAFDLRKDFEFGCLQLAKAVGLWRARKADRQLGFYAIMPWAEYHAPARLHRYIEQLTWPHWLKYQSGVDAWQSLNDRIADRLLPWVTCLVPRLYAFYRDRDAEWRAYADATLTEARRLAQGKPLFPILWPQYHSDKVAIPQETWEMMVRFVVTHRTEPTGIIVWYGEGNQVAPNWRKPLFQLLGAE